MNQNQMNRYSFTTKDAQEYAEETIKEVCKKKSLVYIDGTIYSTDRRLNISIYSTNYSYFAQILNIWGKPICEIYVFVGKDSYEEMINYSINIPSPYTNVCKEISYVIDHNILNRYFIKCGFGSNYAQKIILGEKIYNFNYDQETKIFFDYDYHRMNITITCNEDRLKISPGCLYSGCIFGMGAMKSIFERLELNKKLFVYKMLLFSENIHKDLIWHIVRIGCSLTFGHGCEIL